MSSWEHVLYGIAYGDAWGADVEFAPYEEIVAQHGLRGPKFPTDARITDDTQMTLALADAIRAAGRDEEMLRSQIVTEFTRWLHDEDNTRAPGTTCLNAVGNLDAGQPWWQATVRRSKGCGTIMRTAPAILLPDGLWQPVAAWQGAITHGHPTAVVACLVLTALLREPVRAGVTLHRALQLVDDPELTVNVTGWLAPLLEREDLTLETYLAPGKDEVRAALRRAVDALPRFQAEPWAAGDICAYAGEGWIAEEALAAALLCVDVTTSAVDAVRRGVVTGGDSDSIASIAGAVAGTIYDDPWPADWRRRLEPRYRYWISQAATYDSLVA